MSTTTSRAIIATAITAMTLTASLASTATAAPRSSYVPIPSTVALQSKTLQPDRVRLVDDFGNYRNTLASYGQACEAYGATGREARPLGGRSWTWANSSWSTAVSQNVTVWSNIDRAWNDLVHNTGYCRYGKERIRVGVDSVMVVYPDRTVVTTRVDRALVSVEVTARKDATPRALALSEAATRQVDRANL